MPALHRCHDLRISHSAGDRSRSARRRVQLGLRSCPRVSSANIRIRPSVFTIRARSPARRSSMTTASSSSSTISGPSRRREATRCCSRIRSIAPICRSRRSPGSSTATRSLTARSISRRAGMTRISTACCRKARRLPNACRSSAKRWSGRFDVLSGERYACMIETTIPRCEAPRPMFIAGNFARPSAELGFAQALVPCR